MDGFGLQGKNCAIKALGALLQYLTDTQKRDLPHLKIPKFVDKSKYMSIDVKTRKNLELTVSYRESKRKGSLLWLLDKTDTSMGARLLADWIDRPLQKAAQINARLDGVEELYKSYMLRANLHETLRNVYDIERLVGKIAYNNVTPKDCVALKRSLALLPKIKSLLGDNVKSRILRAINEAISPLYEVTDLLERAIEDDAPQIVKDSDYIKHGFDRELDELFDLAEHGSARISALEEYEKTRTGIKNLKLGYNKVFGYYFETTNSMLHLAPENFIRKQTTTNGERFVSPELKELEEKMRNASYTLDDFLDQMAQLRKMGGMKDMLALIPGIGKQLKDLEIDEREIGKVEAIVLSMTSAERQNPSIINASRKQRIAKGSGVQVQQVNRLLKQFEDTKKMMKKLTENGMLKQERVHKPRNKKGKGKKGGGGKQNRNSMAGMFSKLMGR